MGRLSRYKAFFLGQPAHVVTRRIGQKLSTAARNTHARWLDGRRSSYAALPSDPVAELAIHFRLPELGLLQLTHLRAVSDHYLAHRFDLLGSGWTEVRRGMRCRGLEGHRYDSGPAVVPDRDGAWLANRINPANLDEARSVWRLVDPDYRPIDWQLDFKSGYRWRENIWFKDIAIGHQPGVDVKLPWELARMQHLPQLALAYALAARGETSFASPERYVRTFRNQILDFVATNPPRFGVNWACAMDVAIRIINWLVAYDFLREAGAKFDADFQRILLRSVYEHGHHIISNLECEGGIRGNHYLSDITGLLFVAAYLPPSPESESWLVFSAKELVKEIIEQFYEDGGNFEASTAYHRLSGEIAVYSTALILDLKRQNRLSIDVFCKKYWQRLERLAEFTIDITRPDGRILQIGDNDSGRLLKIFPAWQKITVAQARNHFNNLSDYHELPDEAEYFLEDQLDHRHLVAAVNGLFNRGDFTRFAVDWEMETQIVRNLAGGTASHSERATDRHATGWLRLDSRWLDTIPEIPGRRYSFIPTLHSNTGSLRSDLQYFGYPDFGIYIYRSQRLYLAVRCGPIGLNGLGPHAHNDQLSLELWLDNAPVVVDPGSYIYTPLPRRRREFRSVTAHFAPHIPDIEPGKLDRNIFALGDEAQAECLHFDGHCFIGRYTVGAVKIYRSIALSDEAVTISDWTDDPKLSLAALPVANPGYSCGYGWLCNRDTACSIA